MHVLATQEEPEAVAAPARKRGRAIVITSGKGGVGKTTTTANLGHALAARGVSVALIDADVGLRNLDIVLGLESRVKYHVLDVLEETVSLDEALVLADRIILMSNKPTRVIETIAIDRPRPRHIESTPELGAQRDHLHRLFRELEPAIRNREERGRTAPETEETEAR